MTRTLFKLATLSLALAALQACSKTEPAAVAPQSAYTPITVTHKLGDTVITRQPQRVAALDMNEVDFLDQLGIPVAGTVKDYVPHFLGKYKDDANVQDLGAIVQPNLERVHALKPDLILITSLQANHYKELSEIAPTLHFDVDYRDSRSGHIDIVKQHLLTLGRIFGKEDLARQKAAELDAQVADAKHIIENRPEKALIVLHNNGAFSAFGVKSRYGFVFDALGVKPASSKVEAGLHGQPISSEFIQQADPDIIYIVDRTAVMEHRPVMDAERMANPLLRQTKAWKNGRVVFADADAWYITAASVGSLKIVIDDVLKAYQ
ncbi:MULTISPECIES: siderophore ABC transporter substrate-binding protein [unclassified Janthinobacterium]|uniref:siderophore ABC transporter substrate-binding protein n=1 Tax=unclassified Janthinobacterium TaxID=2610881 RepID=UPI00161343AB|nr:MULTISPECIES: siderophore ABC transporter substrate-binding protein [unclassified Janthinobacterium]MBB5610929.1 iron complex transport system substrate-binding protein [Janthinobacterium sp. S3T4]MBB5616415.1 iron complex transport system substrate-binding protein [Janthinobacterium sp. S3M3]